MNYNHFFSSALRAAAVVFSVCILSGCSNNNSGERKTNNQIPFIEPAPYPDNIERDTGDNGFSRGFGNTNHSYSFDWFDSHMHLAWSHYPDRLEGEQIQNVVDQWFGQVGNYHASRMILLDPYLETMEWAKDNPRVYVFWWMNWDQADQLTEIQRRIDEGLIQGIKLHTGDFRNSDNPDYHVMTTPGWQKVYELCEKNNLPILIHVNEHWGDQGYTYGRGSKRFWEKAGYTNQELLDYFLSEMVEKYPKINWIVAHMNFQGTETLSALMDKYPNLYFDTSIGMFLRQYDSLTPEEIKPYRDFCIHYADRIMFGTDGFVFRPDMKNTPGHIQNWWLPHYIFIMQLRLPQQTLDKITHGTCEKVLGSFIKN